MPYRGALPREIFVSIEGDRGPTLFKSYFSKFLSVIARTFQNFCLLKVPFSNFCWHRARFVSALGAYKRGQTSAPGRQNEMPCPL